MPPISGQSLLVIGGSSGIGAAVARLAAEQGVRVSIASSNPTRVANAVTKIQSQASIPDTHIRGFTIDLSLPDVEQRLERLLTETTADSRLDHIVVTAGRAAMLPITRTDREYMLGQAQLALVVPALLAKLAPRFLKPSYTSSLVFCGGRLGEKPIKGWPAAAAYAAGLDGLTRALALDLAPLRVNVVHPGATETEIWGPTPEQRRGTREFFASTALLGKVGTPEEVAEAFVYLLKDSNITGTSLHSSGGVLVQ
ncbi:3-oxoacyl-[acyl-carrier-protein] reductase FabG [Aspergillus udagawae]|uniref:3-oxoacyl-[acyl-carrier-protein] reductase FabG n=1 Tax=Aspergillus udagawae TaxID=91492 RepID=A0A8H3XS47_9EURO|nr:3-oxoacyl-[acyl-carrier-protein] reductase FabG [Aspergillus udagawae]GFF59505.1 3-oxoacyl-[acyl-carrier-protein] reductase FabG [Aspergillus udagawae]GFG00944.1 3-oxoacyl-[acyl-carrier-protein] reductase FabG [Aspergillus udagawae]GFG17827.1 3-oxoacyl-[acyl-carrier-protein] reductase FabG [Aspergillus udagawae]